MGKRSFRKPVRQGAGAVKMVNIDEIRPSPENDRIYAPVNPEDPTIVALARSIAEYGIKDPIVIELDGFIVSGHRRHAAARLAGLRQVPVVVELIRRADDTNAFVRLLVTHNEQRVKSVDEIIREQIVKSDPDEAYERLREYRREKSDMSHFRRSALLIGKEQTRKAISPAKRPMLAAAARAIEDRREFWPLSDRGIHYALLNLPPLRHAAKPGSTYTNDRASYGDLCNLLTRARLVSKIPWEAIADETRSVQLWSVHRNPESFISAQLRCFLKGYYRDLQQSQPTHIEIVAEKLTVKTIVEQVAAEYCIPVTIGRGYCSISPRRDLAERYHLSGRDRLVLLILSDFDPDGETIAESFARSLRDDFDIQNLTPIKVALTAKQVKQLKLPPMMKAKQGSSRYAQFTERHGDNVFELEAVEPAELQRMLRESIDSVLDHEAFNEELDREKRDAAEIEDRLKAIRKVIGYTCTEDER